MSMESEVVAPVRVHVKAILVQIIEAHLLAKHSASIICNTIDFMVIATVFYINGLLTCIKRYFPILFPKLDSPSCKENDSLCRIQ